jgi:hypothetical protein
MDYLRLEICGIYVNSNSSIVDEGVMVKKKILYKING